MSTKPILFNTDMVRALYDRDANPRVWVIEFERIGREEALRRDS